MKVKLFGKNLGQFENLWFSSDLHLNHEQVLKFGRDFSTVEEMNKYLIDCINQNCGKDDLLVLCGDTMMINKDYNSFVESVNCKLIILYGNHCNRNRFAEVMSDRLLYHGDYCQLRIGTQIIVCSHYPLFHWDYQDDGSISLHGHNHGDESGLLKEIHKYKSMDVGVDAYYNIYGQYGIFSFEDILERTKDKLIIGRHLKN